jgi:phosphoribosylpyrophosphate synthetase
VVGNVAGRVAIMVDDMIDDASAFVAAAEALKERGASRIYILCELYRSDSELDRRCEIDAAGECR